MSQARIGRNRLCDTDAHAGIRSVSDTRLDVGGIKGQFLVEDGIIAALQGLPFCHSLLPGLTLGRIFLTFYIIKGGLVGRDKTAAGSHLYREIAERQATFHRHGFHHIACILNEIAGSAAGGELGHQVERHILGRDALAQCSVDSDAHRLGFLLKDALRGHHHLHLGSADAKGHSPHRAVGGGMRIATDDGHTRQRQSLLGTYYMDDTIILRHHAEMRQSEIGRIPGQHIHLLLRYRVCDGLVLIVRGGVVIRHTEDLLRTETLQASFPHALEGLRRSDLMTIQAVDIQLRGTILDLLDHVPVPYFIK